MKKLILSLALAGAMGFYVSPAMSQASVDPDEEETGSYNHDNGKDCCSGKGNCLVTDPEIC
jgi:hypothetical protein